MKPHDPKNMELVQKYPFIVDVLGQKMEPLSEGYINECLQKSDRASSAT